MLVMLATTGFSLLVWFYFLSRSWKYDARRFWIFECEQLLLGEGDDIDTASSRADRSRGDERIGLQQKLTDTGEGEVGRLAGY